MSDALYAIALSVMSSPASLDLWEYARNNNAHEIFRHVAGRKHITTQDYLTKIYAQDPFDAAEQISVSAAKKDIRIITYWDSEYPVLLREISKPPLVLYTRGDFVFSSSVSVVGTRKADNRSRTMTQKVVSVLVARGLTIVSGMAIGLDREAHCAALDAGGNTIGVLANGIDIAYPRSNEDVYRRMLTSPGSGLVSEYPPGVYTQKWTFTRRNRIISGLSTATVVVKAALKSGSLITARYALEQNRDVYACCGYSFDAEYAGCHHLLQQGACLVGNEDDFKREFNYSLNDSLFFKKSQGNNLFPEMNNICKNKAAAEDDDINGCTDEAESLVLSQLLQGDCQFDEIVAGTGISVSKINETLSMLELTGKIMRRGNLIVRI